MELRDEFIGRFLFHYILFPDQESMDRFVLVLDPVGAEGWGGVERWLWDLALGLRERGHRVCVAGRPGSRWMRRSADAGFALCEVPLRGDFRLDQAYRLSRFMLKEGVDVVATKLHKGIRVSGFAAKFAGHPPVVSFMGLVETRPGLRYRQRLRYGQHLLRHRMHRGSRVCGWPRRDVHQRQRVHQRHVRR